MSARLQFFIDPDVAEKGGVFSPPREGDAGFDIRAAENLVIEAGAQCLVSTGLRLAIPDGYVGLVRDRSSMALAQIYTHAGVIDASYRGEVKIVLSNSSPENYHIVAGNKIAQLIVVPCMTQAVAVESSEALGSTDRGEGGFGSTGK